MNRPIKFEIYLKNVNNIRALVYSASEFGITGIIRCSNAKVNISSILGLFTLDPKRAHIIEISTLKSMSNIEKFVARLKSKDIDIWPVHSYTLKLSSAEAIKTFTYMIDEYDISGTIHENQASFNKDCIPNVFSLNLAEPITIDISIREPINNENFISELTSKGIEIRKLSEIAENLVEAV